MEIGSEFWSHLTSNSLSRPIWTDWNGDKQLFISGRTALYAIIEDAVREYGCRKAYLPSYCCHTMIEPFLKADISIEFYPVIVREHKFVAEYNRDIKTDIFYQMDYFGYTQDALLPPDGAITIHDVTHSIYCNDLNLSSSTYLYASFRKWDAVPGAAIACKNTGQFNYSANEIINEKYISMRTKAMNLKTQFINEKSCSKDEYLALFANAEKLLEKDYVGYTADAHSIAMAKAIPNNNFVSIRRNNAKILINGLKNIDYLSPIIDTVSNGDCPLFVPVTVDYNKRNALKQFLIDNKVYCPVHWPLSGYLQLSNEERLLYDSELSLICDQRYGEKEMNLQIELIRKFGEKFV